MIETTQHPQLRNFQSFVISLSQGHKFSILMLGDLVVFTIVIHLAIGFKFEFDSLLHLSHTYGIDILTILGCKLLVFWTMGVYKPVLRYLGAEFGSIALKAIGISLTLLLVLNAALPWLQLPPSILVNDALFTLLSLILSRLAIRSMLMRLLHGDIVNHRVLKAAIYGAGSAGSLLYKTLEREKGYQPVCFIDDDPKLANRLFNGLAVNSPTELERLKELGAIDVVLLAMPSIPASRRKEILARLQALSLPIKTVPSISEILVGDGSISGVRDIDIEDLLGREQIPPLPDLMRKDITDKVVLVTGAGGSIGSELCRQIAKQSPKSLILYELNEFSLYQIDLELAEHYPHLRRIACLGSVTDAEKLEGVLRKYQVNTVYHAAAYKHVPLVEANQVAGVFNNAIGTLTVVQCSIKADVQKFVLISTDKAVRPTNIMGTTKRVAELILQALAHKPEVKTCLTMVRFGNVLGSSGSVVPRFKQQIAAGKPITLTHPDITRYFMSIPEAAALVIQAGAMAQGGEVFLLDMGEPVKIYDLASQMIRLHGLEPGKDVEIKVTGLRPGEKIYEELLIDCHGAKPTNHPKIFCGHENYLDWEILQGYLNRLEAEVSLNHSQGCVDILRELVPEYQPNPASKSDRATATTLPEMVPTNR
jgi:FlaA1/EpsC-like NDP-sugar epimerase